MLDLSLVLPTYNERDNLAPLLERLSSVLRPYAHEIIVVDDDSPDRTWEEAERLRAAHPYLRVIRRVRERGLSSAVLRGFREARGRVLVVMDADLQHDESVLPRLIDGAAHGHVAAASRAAAGGGLGRWSWPRRVTSWTAAMLARLILDVPLSDPMSGFFALPRALFRRLDDGRLRPEGYKLLLYLYVAACRELGQRNVSVREVGFVFRQRLYGESKLSGRVMREYLRMLWVLRRSGPPPWRLIRFAGVGSLGVIVNTALLLWLHRIGLPYLAAGALAIEAAIVHNFTLNERWTFRSRRSGNSGAVWRRLGKFHLVSCGGMLINLAVLGLLYGALGVPLLLSNLAGIGCAVVGNYAANKLWTWRFVEDAPEQPPVTAGMDSVEAVG